MCFGRPSRRAPNLTQDSLVFALCAVVALEARTRAGLVIAETTAGAVASGLVTLALEHICTGGALDQGAVGAAAAKIAYTANVLRGIPGGRIGPASLRRQLALREAHTSLGAIVRARRSLARNTLVVLETRACA